MIAKFRKNKKLQSFKNNLFLIMLAVVFVGLMGFLIVANVRINIKRGRYISQIEALKREIQNLEEKSADLKKGASQAESKSYLEKIAREQLGLKGAGEEVVIITEEDKENEELMAEGYWNVKSWWNWAVK